VPFDFISDLTLNLRKEHLTRRSKVWTPLNTWPLLAISMQRLPKVRNSTTRS
jgi:hypothetical protein